MSSFDRTIHISSEKRVVEIPRGTTSEERTVRVE